DALVADALELVDVAQLGGACGACAVLPRRNPISLPRRRADRQHRRPRLLGTGLAPLARWDEDARTLRRVDGRSSDREGRAAAHDDVELLVDAGTGAALLEMARHDGLARVRAVGADAERGDAELRAERQPVDPLRTAGREPVDPDGLHASASRSASSTTGSTRAPVRSSRSSRFSTPAQPSNASTVASETRMFPCAA